MIKIFISTFFILFNHCLNAQIELNKDKISQILWFDALALNYTYDNILFLDKIANLDYNNFISIAKSTKIIETSSMSIIEVNYRFIIDDFQLVENDYFYIGVAHNRYFKLFGFYTTEIFEFYYNLDDVSDRDRFWQSDLFTSKESRLLKKMLKQRIYEIPKSLEMYSILLKRYLPKQPPYFYNSLVIPFGINNR